MLLEAGNVTEKLLHALLSLRTLELRDHDNSTGIQRFASLTCFRNPAIAKAALILEITGIRLRHNPNEEQSG